MTKNEMIENIPERVNIAEEHREYRFNPAIVCGQITEDI